MDGRWRAGGVAGLGDERPVGGGSRRRGWLAGGVGAAAAVVIGAAAVVGVHGGFAGGSAALVAPAAAAAPAVASSCGAPANPMHYTYCTTGALITRPDSRTCHYFRCIPNFANGKGYLEECKDGMLSMSGGRSGSCSSHHGNLRPVRH